MIVPFYFSLLSAIGLLAGAFVIAKVCIALVPSLIEHSALIFIAIYLCMFISSYALIYEATFYKKTFLIASIILGLALGFGYFLKFS